MATVKSASTSYMEFFFKHRGTYTRVYCVEDPVETVQDIMYLQELLA